MKPLWFAAPPRWPIRLAAILLALTMQTAAAVEAEEESVQFALTAPKDYQVFQRSTAQRGAVVFEGQWNVPRNATALPDALEARVLDATAPADSPWQRLPFDVRARGFRSQIPVAPGAWYRAQVRLLREGKVLSALEVAHVGVGEVFFIAGQSNSANYGEVRQQPTSGLVVAFDGDRWAIANDPQPGAGGTKGSFIPSFGDALAHRLGLPIGVVCLGVGSTSVREWLPAGRAMSNPPTTGRHCLAIADDRFVSTGELFTMLTQRLREFPRNGIRAVLWHQGESDIHQPLGHGISLTEYRDDLAAVIAAVRSAANWDVPWFVAQVSYGSPTSPGSSEFRAQQLAVTDGRLTFPGPNTDELTGNLREKSGQGVHLSAEGLKRHGELWAEVIGHWIENNTANSK